MTAEANLNNMTLVVRRTRRVPKLIGKVLPNLDEAAQLLRATVVNGIEFLRGRQRFYPGMGLHFRALYRALAAGQPPPVTRRGRAGGRVVVAAVVGTGGRVDGAGRAQGGTGVKALVTGATGFLGRAVVQRLQREGVIVRAFVRPGRTCECDGVERCEGDLCRRVFDRRGGVVASIGWCMRARAWRPPGNGKNSRKPTSAARGA